MCSIERLNNDQSKAFKCIMNIIDRRESRVFFVNRLGEAGKTFLYRAIIAELRNKGHIVLVTASSGIAATLLFGGRTAHSRFKILINLEPSSICNISKQLDLAKLIRQTTAIIWDEAPMANKESVQSLDRTLRDILANDMPFGGKVMVIRGDFRQVVPVVPKGSKSQMISAIVKSNLWASTKILHL
ncbi:ATP-dependent DNA helicase RRM3-like [Arachis hypogaea]|uniref:ATP-dependent DNA helicase RRM3-like n=1 Tax=Arachis hypogaea TaxID=3818 RepID=UPI000DECB49C